MGLFGWGRKKKQETLPPSQPTVGHPYRDTDTNRMSFLENEVARLEAENRELRGVLRPLKVSKGMVARQVAGETYESPHNFALRTIADMFMRLGFTVLHDPRQVSVTVTDPVGMYTRRYTYPQVLFQFEGAQWGMMDEAILLEALLKDFQKKEAQLRSPQ